MPDEARRKAARLPEKLKAGFGGAIPPSPVEGLTPEEVKLIQRLFVGTDVSGSVFDQYGEVTGFTPAHRSAAEKIIRNTQNSVREFHLRGESAKAQQVAADMLPTLQALSKSLKTSAMQSNIQAGLMHPEILDSYGHLAGLETKLDKALDYAERGVNNMQGKGYVHSGEERATLARLKVMRGARAAGIDITKDEQLWVTAQQAQAREKIEDLVKAFNEEKDEYTKLEISGEIAANSQILQQLNKFGESVGKETKSGLEQFIGIVTKIAGVISISSIASRVALQDPYTYRTVPALSAMGQQGEIGSALSQALGSVEEYNLARTQEHFSIGMGAMGLGVAGAFNKNLGRGMRWGAGVGAAAGAGLAGLSVLGDTLGIGNLPLEAMKALKFYKKDEELFGVNMAQQLMNPQRLISNFAEGRTGMLALTERGGDLGYYYDQEAQDKLGIGYSEPDENGRRRVTSVSTGNRILDDIYERNTELLALGVSPDEMAGFISGTAMSLTGRNGVGLTDAAVLAQRVGGGFGIGADSVMGMLEMLQSIGVTNSPNALNLAIGAGADADGNINTFTVGNITQSIIAATQSLKLQNISRNSDDLMKEVSGFRQQLVRSGSPLGEMLTTNPQLFGKVMQDVQASVKGALTNPGLLAFNLSLGSDLLSHVQGRPEVLMRGLRYLGNSPMLEGVDLSNMEEVFNNPAAVYSLMRIGEIQGISDLQVLGSLLQAAVNDPDMSEEDFAALMKAGEDETDSKVMQIVESTLGAGTENWVAQSAAMSTAMQAVMESNIKLNDMIGKYINSGDLLTHAQAAITKILETVEELLGGRVRDDKLVIDEEGVNRAYEAMGYIPQSFEGIENYKIGRDEHGLFVRNNQDIIRSSWDDPYKFEQWAWQNQHLLNEPGKGNFSENFEFYPQQDNENDGSASRGGVRDVATSSSGKTVTITMNVTGMSTDELTEHLVAVFDNRYGAVLNEVV